MRNDRRYVFDTNTLVSAALFGGGTPGEAFRHALQTGIVLLSKATFEEIDEVIAREKFDDYLSSGERRGNLHREWRLGSTGARSVPRNPNYETGRVPQMEQAEQIAP